MSAPQPPPSLEVRHYRLDAECIADAASMEAKGWRLVAVRREPDNAIIATYTYGAITPTASSQPFSPAAPISPSRYAGVALGVRVGHLILVVCMIAVGILNSASLMRGFDQKASATNATYNANTDSLTAICATATANAPTPVLPTATSSTTDLTGPTLGGVYDAFGVLFGCEGASGT